MSAPGRSQGEYRSAQHGCLMSAPGRPKGELTAARSAEVA